MFQDHYWYFSETSTFYITSYPEMKVKANRSWRKASLLTITSLSSTSQSYHSHHYLIFVIVFKLKFFLKQFHRWSLPRLLLQPLMSKWSRSATAQPPLCCKHIWNTLHLALLQIHLGTTYKYNLTFLRGTFPAVEAAKLNSLIKTALWHCFVFFPKILVK